MTDAPVLDPTDRKIVTATQAGLPLVPAPYAEVADWLGLTEAEVIGRLSAMQARVDNDTATERTTAEAQVTRIATLRLKEILK